MLNADRSVCKKHRRRHLEHTPITADSEVEDSNDYTHNRALLMNMIVEQRQCPHHPCGFSREMIRSLLLSEKESTTRYRVRRRRSIRRTNSSSVAGLAAAALVATLTWSSNQACQSVVASRNAVRKLQPRLVETSQCTINILLLRGGGTKNEKANRIDETDKSSDECSDTTANLFDTPISASKTSWFSPLGSLLELSHIVKAEASEETMEDEQQKIGRGGALVKFKPPAPLRHSWLSSTFVAPFLQRPSDTSANDVNFMDDDAEQEQKKRKSRMAAAKSRVTSSVIASAKSVKRVWWVDTWADQRPSEQDAELQLWEERNKNDNIAAATSTMSHSTEVEEGDVAAVEVTTWNDNVEKNVTLQPATSSLDSLAADETAATIEPSEEVSMNEPESDAPKYYDIPKHESSEHNRTTEHSDGDYDLNTTEEVSDGALMTSDASLAGNRYVSSGYVGFR